MRGRSIEYRHSKDEDFEEIAKLEAIAAPGEAQALQLFNGLVGRDRAVLERQVEERETRPDPR